MFDDIIIFHKQRLSQLIGTNKRYTFLTELLNNNQIDENYKAYFNAEVNWWIYEEQLRRNNNPLFDFSDNSMMTMLEEYDRNLYRKARFDRPTIKSVLNSAVTSRLNFLLRPRIALKWFVFRGEPTKPYYEIVKRLGYFREYSYLIDGFVEYVSENKFIKSENDLFSVIEFSGIIEKVDTDYLFTLRPEQFVELIYPMVAYLNPNDDIINLNTEFPIEALIIYLDDKGIEPLKASVEHLLIKKSIRNINGEIFLKLIYELLSEIESSPSLMQSAGNDEKSPLSSGVNEPLDELNKGYRELMDMTDELSALDKAIKDMKTNQDLEEEN